MKQQIAANCSTISIKAWSENSSILGISRNSFIESTVTLECLRNKKYQFTNDELDELIDDYSSKSISKVTKEFKELHKLLPKEVKNEILKMLYSLNLIENIAISTHKQCNFYKLDPGTGALEFLFYYGVIDIKERDIEDYINVLDINMETYGSGYGRFDHYIYIGSMQQFKHASIKSSNFNHICNKLMVPICDSIKIHYLEIEKFIKILGEL